MTRKFYPREINLIKKIVSDIQRDAHHQYVLLNAFADVFYNNEGTIAYNEGFLLFSYEDFKNKTAEILDIEQEVIERALLVKELKDANYIYFILDHEGEEFPYGKIAEGKTPLSKKLPQDIVEILELLKYRVIISTSLCTLLDNNFKTLEEQALDVAQEQLNEAKRQTQFASEQVEEARNQSESAKEQTKEAKKQRFWALATFLISLLLSIPTAYTSYKAMIKGEKCACVEVLEDIKESIDKIDIQSLIDVEHTVTLNQDSIIKLLQPKQEEPKCNQPKKATTTKSTKKATKKQPLYLPLDTITCDGKEYMIVERVK